MTYNCPQTALFHPNTITIHTVLENIPQNPSENPKNYDGFPHHILALRQPSDRSPALSPDVYSFTAPLMILPMHIHNDTHNKATATARQTKQLFSKFIHPKICHPQRFECNGHTVAIISLQFNNLAITIRIHSAPVFDVRSFVIKAIGRPMTVREMVDTDSAAEQN